MIQDPKLFPPIMVPIDKDGLQNAHAILQTWLTKLRTLRTDVDTNADDIESNTSDITTNTANIATNTTNISTNTTNITTLQATIIASGQIQFPATQNASTGVNVLDDYEEGAWTPTDASGATLTFSTAVGSYVKVGKKVMAYGVVTYPVTADGSGAAIGSLPFTIDGALHASANIGYSDFGALLLGLGLSSSTTMNVYVGATAAQATNVQLSVKTLYFSLVYKATA